MKSSEVFVSDGSKCDIGRLQLMFGKGISVAVQVTTTPPTIKCFCSSACFDARLNNHENKGENPNSC